MSLTRAPLFARVLVGASLALTTVTAGFGVQSVASWRSERAGLSVREQRATLRNVAWFRTEFTALLDRLREVLPPDARLLVEPALPAGSERPPSSGGPPRWYLPLAHYGYPLRVYVRRPEPAAIYFTYKEWIDHHFEVLDLDGAGPATDAARSLAAEEERAIDELGIEWRLRIQAWPFELEGLRLDRRVEGGWVEQEHFRRPEWDA